MRSGAMSDAPRSRARATSPSDSSSASAAARTLASTTITVVVQRRHGIAERQGAAGSPPSPVEHLVERRAARLIDEPAAKVLLKRLAGRRGAVTEHRMRLFGDVLDLDARHGAIMALQAP